MLNVKCKQRILDIQTCILPRMHIIIIVMFTKCLIIQNPINKYECESSFLLLSESHHNPLIHYVQRKIQYWVIILVIFIEHHSLVTIVFLSNSIYWTRSTCSWWLVWSLTHSVLLLNSVKQCVVVVVVLRLTQHSAGSSQERAELISLRSFRLLIKLTPGLRD